MKSLIKLFATGLLTVICCAPAAVAQSAHTSLPTLPTYALSGQVIDGSGKPACNIRVCALAEDFDETKPNVVIPCALSDDKGNFLIILHRTGKYKLTYDQVDQGYWPSRLPFFRQPSANIPEVVIEGTGSRGPVTITLPPKNGMLAGKSIDVKTGLPVEITEFVLCHAANPEICRVAVVKSADGQFKVPAPHVPFTLRVKAEGFSDWWGLSGSDKTEVRVAAGTTQQLDVFLTRLASATDRAMSEAEKQPGLHLPAPVQSSPADGVVFDIYPRKTEIEWAPVEGAASYSVEIDYCKPDRQRRPCFTAHPLLLRGNPPMTGISATSYEFDFVGAQPGRWRVWAVDKDGREGFKSPWRTFVYLQ
jgi:hypothetical protein